MKLVFKKTGYYVLERKKWGVMETRSENPEKLYPVYQLFFMEVYHFIRVVYSTLTLKKVNSRSYLVIRVLRYFYPFCFRNSTTKIKLKDSREVDLNYRPSGYGPDELPTALSRYKRPITTSVKRVLFRYNF